MSPVSYDLIAASGISDPACEDGSCRTMGIAYEYISGFWLTTGALAYGMVLLLAMRSAQWWRLRNQRDLNVLLCAILGVLVIWSLKADYPTAQSAAGLNLHLLGATLLTMMFGWSFAILAISLVVTSVSIIQGDSLILIPWNTLLMGVLPVLVSHTVYRLAERHLPTNFFIYVFVCTFFSAALAMGSVILATTAIHFLSGAFDLEYISYNYFQYGMLLMFPEAFVTGMLMSIFVAYRPHWVSTFDDQRYLQKQ